MASPACTSIRGGQRRAALVVEILRGDTSAQEAARQHGLTVSETEQWKERFLVGAENALRSRPLDEEYITPYTPEQNGMIESFFRSLKDECVWQQNFESFRQASEKVGSWISGTTKNDYICAALGLARISALCC